jgi:hypothetical protein
MISSSSSSRRESDDHVGGISGAEGLIVDCTCNFLPDGELFVLNECL